MSLPTFYIESPAGENEVITLSEETSRHVVQVLRMQVGAMVQLADGKGSLFQAAIINDHKKKCGVRIDTIQHIGQPARKVSIAISLLKNASRFEWFLEKATEIGVWEIIPLVCERTERQHFRHDRLQNILVSAMLQSQQAWLPVLHQPITFQQLFREEDLAKYEEKFIAHCAEEEKLALSSAAGLSVASSIILIGPEGDFTSSEITLALERKFKAVTLGETRLRAETAGVVAAALLRPGG